MNTGNTFLRLFEAILGTLQINRVDVLSLYVFKALLNRLSGNKITFSPVIFIRYDNFHKLLCPQWAKTVNPNSTVA